MAFRNLCLAFHRLKLPFGQLIFGEIITVVAARGQTSRLKCAKFYFSSGSPPEPLAGAYCTLPDPLAGFKGAYF